MIKAEINREIQRMNTEMHGKKIHSIDLPDSDNEQPGTIYSCVKYGSLYFSATHHGDHDEFWIVQDKDGRETARYNARYVKKIQWAE